MFIIFGSSFINLSIVFRFYVLNFALTVSSLDDDNNVSPRSNEWVKSNKISICDISESFRPQVYNLTLPEQHPYSVLIFCKRKKDPDGICSGTLISPNWVLTAIHCFENCRKGYIYAGGNSRLEIYRKRPEGSQLQKIVSVCKNERFDVALAKAKKKFEMTKYVNTISLPTKPLPAKTVTACTFTAFGKLLLDKSIKQLDFMRKTQQLNVVWPCDCYYRNWRVSHWEKVANGSNFVCSVPQEDYGVCKGDSGSGLVFNGEVQGVTKSIFSEDNINTCILEELYTKMAICGDGKTSSIFVSVYPIVNWIQSVVQERNKEKYGICSGANTVVSVSPFYLPLSLLWVIKT